MTDEKEQWLVDLLRRLETGDERKTEKQIRIIEAAVEVFSEKGFAAASTSEIAQRAGVAEGTIFRHYKTKKDLLLSIAGPIAAKLFAPFLMRDFVKLLDIPYDRVEDFLRAILRDRLEFARKNMKLIKILVHEVPFQPELLAQIRELFTHIVITRVEKAIRHFQARGALKEMPPWRVIRSTISLFVGMVVFHVFLAPDFPFDEEEEIERTVDILLHGIAGRPS